MGPNRNPVRFAATLTAILFISAPPVGAAQGAAAQVVSTSGSGRLKRCWDLLFETTCRTHHVRLPKRVSVGDVLELGYGSNPKHYRFHIARIDRHSKGGCVLRGSGVLLESEKIEIDDCLPESGGSTQSDRR